MQYFEGRLKLPTEASAGQRPNPSSQKRRRSFGKIKTSSTSSLHREITKAIAFQTARTGFDSTV